MKHLVILFRMKLKVKKIRLISQKIFIIYVLKYKIYILPKRWRRILMSNKRVKGEETKKIIN